MTRVTREPVSKSKGQRSKVKVTGPTTADTLNAPYLPNAKAYTNFKLGRRTEPRFAKVTILILLLRAAFSD